MNSTTDICRWAEQNIPRPLLFKPLAVNKPVLAIAGFILVAIAGFIVWGLLDMFFTELTKDSKANWPYLFFSIIILVACFFFVRLLLKRRKMNIVKIDKEGITTMDGSVFNWQHLKKIVFDKAYKKHAVPAEDRCTGIRFYFAKERIYTKYIVPDFHIILAIAHQLPVEKKNRFSGEYYY